MMSGRAKLLADVLALFSWERAASHAASRGGHASHSYGLLRTQRSCRPLCRTVLIRDQFYYHSLATPSGLSALHAAKKLAMRSPHAVEEKDEGGPSLSAWVPCGVLSLRACRVAWPPCEASATFGVKKCLFSPLNYKACHTHERAPTHVRLSEPPVVQPAPH